MQTLINSVKKIEAKLTNLHLEIANDATLYTIATSVSSVLVFMSGLIIKRYLGPTEFGVWTLVYIILTYLSLFDFGTIAAANKEIPYELGKQDERTAEIIKGTLFIFVGLVAVIVMSALLLYIFIDPANIEVRAKIGLLCIAICLPLFQVQQALTTILWINKKFREASILVLLEASSNSLIGIVLVWMYGLYGMYASFLVTLLLKVGYLIFNAKHNTRLAVHLAWSWLSFKRLISKGIPLQIAGCVNLLKVSLATLLIGIFINVTAVGYYALAISIQNFILLGPNAFWIIMFPRFQERFAIHNDDVSVLQSYFIKPLIGFTFFLLPLLISFSYFLVPVIIRQILPTFVETIPVLKVMFIGTFFLSMECIPGQIMVTTNNLWMRSMLGIINTVIIIVLIVMFVKYNNTLFSFTSAVAIGNLLGFFVNYFAAHIILNRNSDVLKLCIKILLAFLYIFVLLLVIDTYIPFKNLSFMQDLGGALLKWLISLTAMLPLFAIAERDLSLLQTVHHIIASRLSGKIYEK